MIHRLLTAACVALLCANIGLCGAAAGPQSGFRLANGLKIVSITPSPKARAKAGGISIAAEPAMPYPVPPVAGFSPLVAIATSDRNKADDFDWEHVVESSYVGKTAEWARLRRNFVVGILDTGSVVDLVAGDSAQILGLKGSYLTTNLFPIGGVSGTMDTTITKPIGVFAAGLAPSRRMASSISRN